jgi:UTP-glucose-1-phosphate uridylyltransferase
VRQPEALGLGHAVLMAKELVGDEPFAVILPDDIVDTKVGCLKQMVEVFEETHSSILGTEVVEGDAISLYGCLDCEPTRPTLACWRSGTWSKSRSRRTRQVRMRSSGAIF